MTTRGMMFQAMNAQQIGLEKIPISQGLVTRLHICGVTIVEETLTSDEYVSLFLISILNMYI